jgi:hypothetical protein
LLLIHGSKEKGGDEERRVENRGERRIEERGVERERIVRKIIHQTN